MLISLLLAAALAQDASTPVAPSGVPTAARITAYQHFAYVIEVPGNCPRVDGKIGWCLLVEGELRPGSWTPAEASGGEKLSFPTQAGALDYLSQSGWEIWHFEINGLKGAARVDVRRPVATPRPTPR